MDEFASLSSIRRYLQVADDEVADDAKLRDYLYRASRAIKEEVKRDFLPRRQTLWFDHPDNARQLRTESDILEVLGLSHINGASSINIDGLLLSAGCDYNIQPYNNITIPSDSGSLFNFSGTPERSVKLDAITGYREDYDDFGWISTGDTLQSSANSAINTLIISASGGSNARGATPRFTTEMMIRIGGSSGEYMHIKGITSSSELDVVRGIRGTTAASHAASAVIESFFVEPEIEFLTVRLAAWSYKQESDPFRGTLAAPQFGTIELPDSWPVDVQERLKKYKLHTIKKAY